MGKKQQKRYVVWKGFEPGVFDSRDVCKQSINGYAGAVYKSFISEKLAREVYEKGLSHESEIRMRHLLEEGLIMRESVCTDAACSGNPGQLERRCVETVSGKELFRSRVYESGTVNIGEYIGLLRGMKYLMDKGLDDRVIYTDSVVAMSRFRNQEVKTDLYKIESNADLRHALDQRHAWRLSLSKKCPKVVKRKTKEWGEIPADFGRK